MKKLIALAAIAILAAGGFAFLLADAVGAWTQLIANCANGCLVIPTDDGGVRWVKLEAVGVQCPAPQDRSL